MENASSSWSQCFSSPCRSRSLQRLSPQRNPWWYHYHTGQRAPQTCGSHHCPLPWRRDRTTLLCSGLFSGTGRLWLQICRSGRRRTMVPSPTKSMHACAWLAKHTFWPSAKTSDAQWRLDHHYHHTYNYGKQITTCSSASTRGSTSWRTTTWTWSWLRWCGKFRLPISYTTASRRRLIIIIRTTWRRSWGSHLQPGETRCSLLSQMGYLQKNPTWHRAVPAFASKWHRWHALRPRPSSWSTSHCWSCSDSSIGQRRTCRIWRTACPHWSGNPLPCPAFGTASPTGLQPESATCFSSSTSIADTSTPWPSWILWASCWQMHHLWEQHHLAGPRSHCSCHHSWHIPSGHYSTARRSDAGHRNRHCDHKRPHHWWDGTFSPWATSNLPAWHSKIRRRRRQQCLLPTFIATSPGDLPGCTASTWAIELESCTRACHLAPDSTLLRRTCTTTSKSTTTQQVFWKRFWHLEQPLHFKSFDRMRRGGAHCVHWHMVPSPWSATSMWRTKSSKDLSRSCYMDLRHSSTLEWWNWSHHRHHDLPGATFTALHSHGMHFGTFHHRTSSKTWLDSCTHHHTWGEFQRSHSQSQGILHIIPHEGKGDHPTCKHAVSVRCKILQCP